MIEHLPEALRSLGRPVPQNVTCVVYDRPPRTGSSTVSDTLGKCLLKKGYDWGKGPWMEYDKVIPFMVSLPARKKAIVRRHIVVPYWQLRLLIGHCNKLLWISSTRVMKERLVSKAKFDVRGKHGSSVLGKGDEALVKKNLMSKDSDEAEMLYESYPFVSANKTLRIMPDYIIRSEHLENDLELLMRALDCPNDIKTSNVHTLNGTRGDTQYVKGVTLKLDDKRHKMMTSLATEFNERGLEYATKFR